MSRLLLIFLTVTISLNDHQVESVLPLPSFSDIKNIIQFCYEMATKIKTAYDLYEKYFENKQEVMDQIMAQLSDVPDKLIQMESKLTHKLDVMLETILNQLPIIENIDASMRELHNYIVRVDGMFDNYVYYSKDKNNFNDYTIKRFISSVTSENLGDLQDILNKIHRLVIPSRTSNIRDSLLYLISKYTAENYLKLCDDTLSPAQQLYELYQTIALTEMKGYAMTSFAYGILPRYENVTFKAELDKAEAKLARRSQEYLKVIQKAMWNAPKDIRRCDPKSNERNVTFFEMEQLFQAYIVAEPDLEWNSCMKTCPTVTSKRVVTCIDTEFCPHERSCQGSVTDCTYGGGRMKICKTKRGNRRRYEWFEDNAGKVYGNGNECSGTETDLSGWIRGFVRCDYCICTCSASDPDSKAIRTISLMPQTTDIDKNMVVTGLKFVLKERMMHIQIKQGRLMPEGQIDNTSEVWKPLEHLKWTGDSEWSANFYRLRGGNEELLVRTRDYDHVTRFHKTVFLDDVVVPKDHVVTGVRFAQGIESINGNYKPFMIEVQATPFDMLTGKLTATKFNLSKWISASKMNPKPTMYSYDRTELMLNSPHDPVQSQLNFLDSSANQYINFRASDFRKDAGQSTVPFFDGQPLETNPPTPLLGVALSHRGTDGFGGFLTLRVFTLDMADHINFDIPHNLLSYYRALYPDEDSETDDS